MYSQNTLALLSSNLFLLQDFKFFFPERLVKELKMRQLCINFEPLKFKTVFVSELMSKKSCQ